MIGFRVVVIGSCTFEPGESEGVRCFKCSGSGAPLAAKTTSMAAAPFGATANSLGKASCSVDQRDKYA
jgi:hypothetical protein